MIVNVAEALGLQPAALHAFTYTVFAPTIGPDKVRGFPVHVTAVLRLPSAPELKLIKYSDGLFVPLQVKVKLLPETAEDGVTEMEATGGVVASTVT